MIDYKSFSLLLSMDWYCVAVNSCSRVVTVVRMRMREHLTFTLYKYKYINSTGTVMDLSNYTIPLDTPISALEAEEAFNGLSDDEKLYCHFLSRGSWEGAPICLLQTSPESVPLFMLLKQLFSRQSVASLRTAVGTSLSDDEFQVRYIELGVASGWGQM